MWRGEYFGTGMWGNGVAGLGTWWFVITSRWEVFV
jgi:hypothetical protein